MAGPTRLDWEFAVKGFGKGAAKLPSGYDSAKQKYDIIHMTHQNWRPFFSLLLVGEVHDSLFPRRNGNGPFFGNFVPAHHPGCANSIMVV